MLRHLAYWLHRLANPPLLAIRIRDRVATSSRGKAPPGLLEACSDVAADFAIDAGHLHVAPGFPGARIRFSPHIPDESHQRFRNVIGAHSVRS